jgi:hypothetical protein
MLQRNAASEDVYKLSLGSLAPGEVVEVTISYVASLVEDAAAAGADPTGLKDSKQWRLVVPVALLHRHVSARAVHSKAEAEVAAAVDATVAAIAAAEAGGKEQPPLRLSVADFSHHGVLSLTSPTHGEYLVSQVRKFAVSYIY